MRKRKFTFTIGKEWNIDNGFEDINEGMTTKTARSVQAFLKKIGARPLDCKGTWGEMVDSGPLPKGWWFVWDFDWFAIVKRQTVFIEVPPGFDIFNDEDMDEYRSMNRKPLR